MTALSLIRRHTGNSGIHNRFAEAAGQRMTAFGTSGKVLTDAQKLSLVHAEL